ncbi:MAG: site-2 protease family protein [Acidobacteriota bacterium]
MSPDVVASFAIWFLVFLFSLTAHEAAHAAAAYLGGDDTAYRGGQVSLNPVPHIMREPFGTILVPVFTFFTAGWMMGWASTPYDPEWGRRCPRRQAVMSLAGPAANLLIALVAFGILRLLLAQGLFQAPDHIDLGKGLGHLVEPASGNASGPLAFAGTLLSVALNLNVLLGLFNLLPIPPLDGAGVVEGLFPDTAGRALMMLRANPMLSLLSLLAAWKLFGWLATPALGGVLELVHPAIYRSL